jgi:8-oxo-dGTP pyrophosphatase MutT (NUDIX family)
VLRFLYRPNVLCLLYKRTERGSVQALLVKRAGTRDHWQLPQGGTEGEDAATAGRRELWEELGTNNFTDRGTFENVYRYRFGETTTRYASVGRQVKGYKGQKQSLYVAEFTGTDSEFDIKYWDHVDWKWVDLAAVADAVHPVRRAATRIAVDALY